MPNTVMAVPPVNILSFVPKEICIFSLVLLGGDPGIGKSTLILQSATAMAHERSVLYVAAEESAEQVKLRWN